MIAAARGLLITFVLFAASFALHIVGGATDRGWLFAIAVALIFLTATGFPAIALMIAGLRWRRGAVADATAGVGFVAGTGFTLGALWAANDRSFAAWEFALAPVLVAAATAAILVVRSRWSSGTLTAGRATS